LSYLQTIVISMLRSPDRRERARQELAKTNLQWRFLDAIDGKLLQFPIAEYDNAKVEKLLGFPLMPGEIGAFLSHKAAWQACIDQNQTTLIFEDDFILLPQFEKVIQYLLNDYTDWDLMRLQALEDSPYSVIKDIGDVVVAYNLIDALGCTAYLVKPVAAHKLIKFAYSIYEPIDHYLEHASKHGIVMKAVRPYPSDISQMPTTVYRPDRLPTRGMKKIQRSISRWIDRHFSKDPWFPK